MSADITLTIKATPELIDEIARKVIELTMPEHANKEITYTVKEVAKIVDKSTQTITIHIRRGLLIANKTGKSYTITQSNLNKYINGE